MMDLHNVEIAKTKYGETVLLDGKEVKGLKDFIVIRKANNSAVLHLELLVGEVNAVDRRAEYHAKEFEKWADRFNKKFEVKPELDGKILEDAVRKGFETANVRRGVIV